MWPYNGLKISRMSYGELGRKSIGNVTLSLPSATKLRQGNVFTFSSQGGVAELPGLTPPGSRHPPGSSRPPLKQTRPCAVHVGRYGQQAGSTHPTGMHTCFAHFVQKKHEIENNLVSIGGEGGGEACPMKYQWSNGPWNKHTQNQMFHYCLAETVSIYLIRHILFKNPLKNCWTWKYCSTRF